MTDDGKMDTSFPDTVPGVNFDRLVMLVKENPIMAGFSSTANMEQANTLSKWTPHNVIRILLRRTGKEESLAGKREKSGS